MQLSSNQIALITLVKAGLWEKDAQLGAFHEIDFNEIYRLSEEQSVVGLVTAGLEHVKDVKPSQESVLTFIGSSLQLEQRNKAMNVFIKNLVERLRKEGIYTLLIKGQGIAQCYERPLWRASGDVDLFLSDDNYEKAKALLIPMASSVERENRYTKHYGMVIDGWEVELHGYLRSELFGRIDRGLDEIRNDTFYSGSVRSWINNGSHIFLPSVDNDVIIIFTHILQHFFKGGVGLRQVCDWCRLLWTYRTKLDVTLLENRLQKMGMMSEWRAFATLAVEYMGMPAEAMPLYNPSRKWVRKSDRVLSFILETGNFGHNTDNSYRTYYTGLQKRAISAYRYSVEGIRHFFIFPLDSMKVWWGMMKSGFRATLK